MQSTFESIITRHKLDFTISPQTTETTGKLWLGKILKNSVDLRVVFYVSALELLAKKTGIEAKDIAAWLSRALAKYPIV
jgi:hypothetical protein